MNELFRRLRYLLHRGRFDDDLASDLEFHREMAARAGGRPLGDALRLREQARDAWGWTWIDRCAQDLRYAVRTLRKSPGFTVAAVLMLAIGIGVNVAAFGFFNLIVLSPLPVRDPDTLLRFERRSPERYASDVPYPVMAFVRDHSRTLSAVLALSGARLATDGEEKPISTFFVTSNYFNELGAGAALGRTLDPILDEASGAGPAVVLSHGFWQRHYGADPFVVGRTIRLNGKPASVVGVVSDRFGGLTMGNPDVWVPITQQPYFVDGSQLFTDFSVAGGWVKMWGRLQPGLTANVVEDELRSLVGSLRSQHPTDIWENESLRSKPGGYANLEGGSHAGSGTPPTGKVYTVLALIGSLALLILAVACANLGGLLLARGVAREREITIRVAVGAGSRRLIRQLFTESLVLALLGSIAGVAVGYVVLATLMRLTEAPTWINPAPDWRVIGFAVATGFAAAIIFGLAPALQIVRQRHRSTLMRQCLIAAQVAASCVLLIVAGLLVRALDRVMSSHPGFDYEHVVSIDPGLSDHGYSSGAARGYLDALKDRLRALPGVESVSLSSTPPLGGRRSTFGTDVAGRAIEVDINRVDPHFLQTMTIPMLRGRNLTPGDSRSVVVSQSLALLHWPGEDALGKQFDNHTVVGVSGSARLVALQDPDAVEAYYLVEAGDLPSMVVLVKTSGSPEGTVPVMSSVARSIDPKVFPQVQLLKTSFRKRVKDAELSAMAVSVLGVSALLLACIGIVGLVAFTVSQRTKEIGIRMALGAKASHVLSIVLQQLSRPIIAGVLAGIVLAAGLSQILRRELYGISNLDPIAYLAAIGVFVLTAALTALWPARRALRVDPLQALRHE